MEKISFSPILNNIKSKPTLKTDGYAIDTVENKNRTTVTKQTENYGYNTNLSDLQDIIQDKNVYDYLNSIFDFSSGNINAYRLEDFQDGTFYLEFNTDKGDSCFENKKSTNPLGMDLSYESAVMFALDEDGGINALTILDEDDIQKQQNCETYTRDTVVFEDGQPFIATEDIDLSSLKGFFDDGINDLSDKELLKIAQGREDEFEATKNEQAKMITHLLNPTGEDETNFKTDIQNAQSDMVNINNPFYRIYKGIRDFAQSLAASME